MNASKSTLECTPAPECAENVAVCDVCEAAFADEARVFVGMTAGGELIKVSDCCRSSLTSVLGKYMHDDADMAIAEG